MMACSQSWLGKQLKLCFTKITKIDCGDDTDICEYNKNHWIKVKNMFNFCITLNFYIPNADDIYILHIKC